MQTRVIKVNYADLTLLDKNARFMKGAMFEQLVKNIQRDGCLTSLPVVNRQSGKLEVASGNHRVAAAIKAGLVEGDALEIVTPLTREQFVAIQLSHNAIAGEDDPNVLRALYDELGFDWKEYSGLSDDAFDVNNLDTSVLRVEQPFYEELHVSFLPGDAEVFKRWLEKIGKSKSAATRYVGLYEDFRLFFETLVDVKDARGVVNTAVALRMMAELAGQALEKNEREAAPSRLGQQSEKSANART